MTQVIAAIIAIFKAFPIADKWLDIIVEQVIALRMSKLTSQRIEKEQKKSLIYHKMQEAKTNEERRILFSVLNDIDRV